MIVWIQKKRKTAKHQWARKGRKSARIVVTTVETSFTSTRSSVRNVANCWIGTTLRINPLWSKHPIYLKNRGFFVNFHNRGMWPCDLWPFTHFARVRDIIIWIEEGAFCNCQSLMSISLPKGIKRIENRTFYNCQALSSITIPDNVTFIASEAFAGCTGLASVTLPENLTQIGDKA